MWRDAHVLMNIEQKRTYLRVLLTGFVHDCWHFTVATIFKTWVIENVDSLVNKYIRK